MNSQAPLTYPQLRPLTDIDNQYWQSINALFVAG